jgi:hypothetical protein
MTKPNIFALQFFHIMTWFQGYLLGCHFSTKTDVATIHNFALQMTETI